jgi:hypothetical protein
LLFVPQITGGTLPAGPVRENVSVRHWVAELILTPAASVVVLPPTSYPTEVVTVVGPAMTKLLKSIRIWKLNNYFFFFNLRVQLQTVFATLYD